MDEIDNLQFDLTEWANSIFTQSTLSSRLNHLRSELEEVEKDPKDILEWADVLTLYMNAAANEGFKMTEILIAVEDKFEINRNRQWGKPNELGYVEHI